MHSVPAGGLLPSCLAFAPDVEHGGQRPFAQRYRQKTSCGPPQLGQLLHHAKLQLSKRRTGHTFFLIIHDKSVVNPRGPSFQGITLMSPTHGNINGPSVFDKNALVNTKISLLAIGLGYYQYRRQETG